MIEIKVQELANNVVGKIVRIYKQVSERVEPGDKLFDIEANKTTTTIQSNASGSIESIEVETGASVKNGNLLATIDGVIAEKAQPKQVNFDYLGSLLKPQKEELESEITIIGGGPGGYVAAIHAAKLGANVILVEKDMVGGTCLNRGCIPTKALVRSAEVFKNLQHAEEYGCQAANISLNMKKVIERKNQVVKQLVQGIHYLLNQHQIRIITGTAQIKDNETVYIKKGNNETFIHSKNIIIASGSQISKLPIPGLELKNVINSDEALDMMELPKELVIIGGGVIGMEFACIYANFGVKVSVIEYVDEVLCNCDSDICQELHTLAEARGMNLFTSSKVESIMQSENGQLIVSFTTNEVEKYITADKVLVAVGRTPFIEGLGIEELGIELNLNGKGIKVNDKMQTNIPNIYAIGDVTNKVLLAHVASHQGMVAVNNILGQETTMDYTAIPSVIFTDPEIAQVGMTEGEAQRQGLEITVGKFPFKANGKALTLGESEGFIKLIAEKETGKLLGGSIIGPHATDLIAEITLAIKNQLTAEKICETIHAHPTTAEVIHEAALDLEGGAIHFVR